MKTVLKKSDLAAIKIGKKNRWERFESLVTDSTFSSLGIARHVYFSGIEREKHITPAFITEDSLIKLKDIRKSYVKGQTDLRKYTEAFAFILTNGWHKGSYHEDYYPTIKRLSRRVCLGKSDNDVLSLEKALSIILQLENRTRCYDSDHGYGQISTYNGKTAKNVITLCPIAQSFPVPSYSFHSEEEVIKWAKELISDKEVLVK